MQKYAHVVYKGRQTSSVQYPMETDYEGEHLEYELCQERDLGSLELLKQYESDDESSEKQTSITSGEFYRGTSPMNSTSM